MRETGKYDSSVKYYVWLSMCKNIGNVRAKLLIDYFGNAEKVFYADHKELTEISGISSFMLGDLMNKDLKPAGDILAMCERADMDILTISDKKYPERLRNIFDPPTVLYVRGDMPDVDNIPVVGIVGTRECTPYGVKNAEKTGFELSQRGIAVATGLARGIDTAAATGALGGKMPVIGVVGCGADVVYPKRNMALFEKVVTNGAVVSEYPPGTEARPEFFPSRNRIISGLSVGVAIIEAPQRSGALITARDAMEQGRDVFTMPGNVDARACMGSNRLLREGAIPFICADDIIDEYKDIYPGFQKPIDNEAAVDYIDVDKFEGNLEGNEKILAEAVRGKALHINEIIDETGIAANIVLATLTELQIKGRAERDNYGKWEII